MDKFEGHPLEITYRGITVPPVYHKYLDNLSFVDFKRGVDAALDTKQLRVAKYIPSEHESTKESLIRREQEDGSWLSDDSMTFSKYEAEELIKLGIWEIIEA